MPNHQKEKQGIVDAFWARHGVSASPHVSLLGTAKQVDPEQDCVSPPGVTLQQAQTAILRYCAQFGVPPSARRIDASTYFGLPDGSIAWSQVGPQVGQSFKQIIGSIRESIRESLLQQAMQAITDYYQRNRRLPREDAWAAEWFNCRYARLCSMLGEYQTSVSELAIELKIKPPKPPHPDRHLSALEIRDFLIKDREKAQARGDRAWIPPHRKDRDLSGVFGFRCNGELINQMCRGPAWLGPTLFDLTYEITRTLGHDLNTGKDSHTEDALVSEVITHWREHAC